jgi:hypothetical protein
VRGSSGRQARHGEFLDSQCWSESLTLRKKARRERLPLSTHCRHIPTSASLLANNPNGKTRPLLRASVGKWFRYHLCVVFVNDVANALLLDYVHDMSTAFYNAL